MLQYLIFNIFNIYCTVSSEVANFFKLINSIKELRNSCWCEKSLCKFIHLYNPYNNHDNNTEVSVVYGSDLGVDFKHFNSCLKETICNNLIVWDNKTELEGSFCCGIDVLLMWSLFWFSSKFTLCFCINELRLCLVFHSMILHAMILRSIRIRFFC